MKNIVEHFSEGGHNLSYAMGNLTESLKRIINKYNKEGYKVVSTETIKVVEGGSYLFNMLVVFEKVE